LGAAEAKLAPDQDDTTRGGTMATVQVGTENSAPIEIYYEDVGTGQPVVLIHGYPLDGHSWERQTKELLDAGYRVISYDRRGWGQSSKPTTGHDYDTYAADLKELLEQLELTDIVLGGFSMGTGEVTRYLGAHGSDRVEKAMLFGAIPPFLLKTEDNPEGVDGSVFEGIKEQALKDRYVWFKQFFDDFYNVDKFAPERISDEAWRASFNVACMGSPYSTYACVDAWLTDFRDDVPKIDVPVLVVHGIEDRILPYESTAARLSDLIDDVRVIPVEEGPHNIGWTHPEVLNPLMLAFLEGGLEAVDEVQARVTV
jgi:non-heme chloroperoxidase